MCKKEWFHSVIETCMSLRLCQRHVTVNLMRNYKNTKNRLFRTTKRCSGTFGLTSCCLLCTRPQGAIPTAMTFFWETAGAAAEWSLTASPTQRDSPSLRPPVKIQAPGDENLNKLKWKQQHKTISFGKKYWFQENLNKQIKTQHLVIIKKKPTTTIP